MRYFIGIFLLLSCSSDPIANEKISDGYYSTSLTPKESDILSKNEIEILKIVEINPNDIKGLNINKDETVNKRFFAIRIKRSGNTPSKTLLWFDISFIFGKYKQQERVSVHIVKGEAAYRIVSINWPIRKKYDPTEIILSGFSYK